MSRIKRIIAISLILSLILTMLSGCAESASSRETVSPSPSPDINIQVFTGDGKPGPKEDAMTETATDENASISSMVYSAVSYDLQSKGFDTHRCVAVASDTSYEEYGLGYYNKDFQLFDSPDYASVGFVTVASQNDPVDSVPKDTEYIAVEPLEGVFDDCDALYHIMTFSCRDISSGHFVFEGKYVVYYQQDAITVRETLI